MEVSKEEKMQKDSCIYKWFWDVRGGTLTGIFVTTKKELTDLQGITVYLGEVLGKHSNVNYKVDLKHFTEVTDDPVVVETFEKYKMETGYNIVDIHQQNVEDGMYDNE